MKIAIRVDASAAIGTGHVNRCRMLAFELKARGCEIRFLCRANDGNLIHMLLEDGFTVVSLPTTLGEDSKGRTADENYGLWLGVSQAYDAMQTLDIVANWRPDWIIVDHYGLDIEWESIVRRQTARLMVIDDLANRRHECDLLLDQNYAAEPKRRYHGLVPPHCPLLLGPRYALLHPQYAIRGTKLQPHKGIVCRVLAFFGGTDATDATGLALSAMSSPDLRTIHLDLITGANYPHRERLEEQAKERGNASVRGPLPDLVEAMAEADLAIGAGGSTSWERLCLGLPSVIVSVAANQRPASEALADDGLAVYAGPINSVETETLRGILRDLIDDRDRMRSISDAGRKLVDGYGAGRVADALCYRSETILFLRPATKNDLALYFRWANDPTTRANAFDQNQIELETHRRWFRAKLSDENCAMYVLMMGVDPVGQIRFDQINDYVEIGYSIDNSFRGQGLGLELVRLGMSEMIRSGRTSFRARVKHDNHASASIFRKAGFVEMSESKYLSFSFHRSASDGEN